MKERLVSTLREMEELLRACGWDDRAEWLAKRRLIAESAAPTAPEFREALKELGSVLVGMGSFSDVPMYPKPGAAITRQEALTQQWELTQRLGEITREIIGPQPS